MVKTDCYHYFETTCSCRHFCNINCNCECDNCNSYISKEEVNANIMEYAAKQIRKLEEMECNK